MDTETLQSQTISFLRFPLSVGVVLIHSRIPEINGNDYPVYSALSFIISENFCGIAVPLFFFFSGFLFFHKVKNFSRHVYSTKLKKRVHSLLIPYLFWNLALIALFWTAQELLPALFSGKNKMISDYTFADWMYAFWDKNLINHDPDVTGDFPFNGVLWFVRDLMVMCLLSPVIHLLLTRAPKLTIGISLAWYLFPFLWIHTAGFNTGAISFFIWGAYFSVHKKSFLLFKPCNRNATALLSTFIGTIVLRFYITDSYWGGVISSIGILFGMCMAVTWTAGQLQARHWTMPRFLVNGSFFLYAYQFMILDLLLKMAKKIGIQTDWFMLLAYLSCATVTVTIGMTLYYFLQKYLPKTTAFITGGR